MCGRFALKDSQEKVMNDFQIQHSKVLLEPRYNISPSQNIPVIIQQDGIRRLETLKWGLIPFWSKTPKPMINARSESASVKPAFRQAFKKKRCLIPASGFFEWAKEDREKQPYYIFLKDKSTMAFAGLWEEWSAPDGKIVKTCAILTVEANSFLKFIHHRMPVILKPVNGMKWLDIDKTESSLKNLLIPIDPEYMEAWKVTRQVNIPSFDKPDCLERLD
jgi:Uncharacterized conserved protein